MRNSIFFFFLFSASLFGQAPTSSVNPESFTSGSISDTSKVRVYSRRDGANRKFEFWKLRLMFAPHARTSPIAYTPSASGNVSNKGEMVVTVAGNPYYIDGYGAAIQTNKLINSSVTSAHIVNSTITTNDILNATILGEDIGDMDASSGQVLTWTGSTWEPQAGNATSEPSRQIVFGTGSGVDSDTSLTLTTTKTLTQKLPTLDTLDLVGRRVVTTFNQADADYASVVDFDRFVVNDPASDLGPDSLTIGLSSQTYEWQIKVNAANNLVLEAPYTVIQRAAHTTGANTFSEINREYIKLKSWPATATTTGYNSEQVMLPTSALTWLNATGSGHASGVPLQGLYGADTTHGYAFMGNQSIYGIVSGYLTNAASGDMKVRGAKGGRKAMAARQVVGTKPFDWWAVNISGSDTTGNLLSFYGHKYAFPNAAPSATSTTKSRLEWTGETPAFASTLTNTATLDFPSTAAGSVSDLTVTVTGAADGDIVQIGVPNAAVSATGSYFAWVSATNTVTIRLKTEATEDPASASFKVWVIK
jgi:hypothetical protein